MWEPAPPHAPGPPGATPPPSTSGLAVASLVLGVLSWTLCAFVGGIAAVITGHLARGRIRRTEQAGNGMALAGLILGYVNVVFVAALSVIVFIVYSNSHL